MIWPLLILFMVLPGGKNQWLGGKEIQLPSYRVTRPCDAQSISTIITPPKQGKYEYNLLLPLPASYSHFILKFDSPLILTCEPSAYIGTFFSLDNTAYLVETYEKSQSQNNDRVMNCLIKIPNKSSTIPYVQSILLNQTHELCQNPKTHYFDDIIIRKTTVAPNVPVSVSSAIPNKNEEKDAALQSYFERLINQEKQLMGTKVKEEKTFVPVIVSSTISKMNEENNKDNEFKSTTIRNPVLLSIVPNVSQSEVTRPILGQTCGRQKVLHTPLIVHGQASKAAHWPWHVALNRIENFSLRYICGGTLLSKTVVLTAAHCATIRGGAIIPELLRVDLGRHDLFGHDVGQQEREVFQVIIHPKFDALTLDNDIALLKLKSEAIFTDYVQPACLWYEEAINKLPYKSIFGTVAGWGFDHQDSPSYILQQITIPLVPELTCLKSNPTFFHKQLNSNKFCAGFGNGTAVCNGDSGGGLVIFVTETPGGSTAGAWHVRGIVSVAPRRTDRNVCDPDQYTIFTDVEKYREWVLGYLN